MKNGAKSTINEFKDFILRGNVVDLAIAVVIGTAFGAVVKSFIQNIVTPLIGIPGKKDFSALSFTIHGAVFRYGQFINDAISFLTIAAVVFFFIVKPMNHLLSLRKVDVDVSPSTKTCPECMSSIPVAAHRCAFCTSEVSVTA